MGIFKNLGKFVLIFFVFVGCTTSKKNNKGQNEKILSNYSFYQSGIASFYHYNFSGRKTANGEIFDPKKLTAASKTLPFKSTVLVRDVKTGKSVLVVINDRGPNKNSRVIDLSEAAAQKLGITKRGIAKVDIFLVSN
ncbi:septal ring lytic transglycosylase RlpA family protein [Pigmentibacter sp. JX0631]|uniref:septal ring lytic transglycosylase RlpA family protein n=1 Tax=Pigmentibacter sp. JX0631 TaxID=2976982 RepID=UPI00246833EC|nr:septal ring lytic transglycosylase RlpA family protein [Pigmentibacter sp. JX0631]WGL58722.1 septal ring lytic transglycosylase RlpA family protein [Pigmentibacter sp. JX0631]